MSRRSDSRQAELRRAIALPSDQTLLRVSGWAMVLFAALFVGFVFHLAVFSNLAEHRSQTMLYNSFRSELAFGTAPIGQVDSNGAVLRQGAPVALLAIPSLGITDTVVEGTAGRVLLDGPGHRRDTPLPGQQGISVIYGRQASYGGPFADIAKLKAGATISTTTGQGQATYRVVDVRHAGDKAPALASPSAGRLTLVTADGTPFLSGSVVRVDADLVGKAFPAPQPVLLPGSLSPAEDPLASDSSGWLQLFLWGELAIIVTAAVAFALRRWGTWHAWIVGIPLILLIGTEMAKQLVIVFPNLY
ncbi:MAG: sortase [Marmoricola sp.]